MSKIGAKTRAFRTPHALAAISLATGLCVAPPAWAAEYGLTTYPLGAQAAMAGFTPPPGVYASDSLYYYTGGTGGSLRLPIGVRVARGVNESILMNATTLSVVTKARVAGGLLGFAATLPFGQVKVDASQTFTGPLGATGGGALSDTETGLGDMSLTALLGWQNGAHHWNLALTGIVPTGKYSAMQLAFVGLNRPGVDVKGAYTWLNPKKGLEVSGGAGVMFNQENGDTHYTSGDELHLEAAVTQHFRSGWAVGMGAYQYVQLSNDSGAGAKLGPFKGQATGVGPLASYTFMAWGRPVQLAGRWFHEFNVHNRASGDSVALGIVVPLASFVPPQAH
jgi:hypothetical protein